MIHVISTPVITGNQIVVRTPKSVIAIDATSGTEVWKTPSEAPMDFNFSGLTIPPLVNNNLILIPEDGSAIAALSSGDGKRLWKIPGIANSDKYPNQPFIDSYVIKDEMLFVARDGWSLAAYDLRDGKLLWENSLPDRNSFELAVDPVCVYMSIKTAIRCYNPTDGKLIWEKDFGSVIRNMILNNGTLYLSLFDGPVGVAAMDVNTLSNKWTLDYSYFPKHELDTLTILGNNIFVGDNKLLSINKDDGSIKWIADIKGPLEHPIELGPYIIVRNTGKDVYLIDAQSGQLLGNLTIKSDSTISTEPGRNPASDGNMLIVPFGDKRLFAYKFY